jgi:hypothetical protein
MKQFAMRQVAGEILQAIGSQTVFREVQRINCQYQYESPKYSTIWGETRTLNTQQANKLLATEMEFWRRSPRKLRKEKVRNDTVRAIMEVGKNILEVIEEKRLRWFVHVKRMPGNRLPRKVLEWKTEGTRRKGRPKERWIDGVRREHDKPWTDRRGY